MKSAMQLQPARIVGAILLVWFCGPFRAAAYVGADAQTMITSFNNAFYFTASGNRGYFRNTTEDGTTWFWGRANQMEMLIDLYEQTTNAAYLTQFNQLYNGFVSDYGTSWIWNEYNDDIMWMVIACSRAYQKTGNTTYRSVARSNFDACYARAWSSDLGGGLFWKSPLNTSKNACVNGPAAIASYLIYQNYGDTNYLARSEAIYQWERATLFEANTGRVYDSVNISGTNDTVPITYNQGTFIGAANYLGYTNDAILAANYTRNSMGSGGQFPNYEEHSDLGGFNGIFVRWMVKFMRDRNLQSSYQLWLQQNANAAWNMRRQSDHLSWSKWWDQTPAGERYSFGCWGSVLIVNLLPPTQNPGGPVVLLHGSDIAGTSSFESGLNWAGGQIPSWTNHYVVASGRTLRAPADGLHHTFAGSSLTLSNGGVLAFKSTSGSRYISIGTDLFLDGGEVANWAGNSASLGVKVTLRAGGGRIDPQGNSFTFPALIGGPGSLRIGAGASSALGGTVTLAGVNTYIGGTVVDAPHTLQVSGSGNLGNSGGSLSFSNSTGRGYGTFNLNGNNVTVGNLNGAGGTIWNNKSGTTNVFTIGNSNATGGFYVGGIANGSGVLSLIKTGSGVITLAGTASHTGGTTVSGGTLQFGDGVARNGIVTGNITNDAALVLANPTAQNFGGVIRGSGTFSKTGAGQLTLTLPNPYTGSTIINSGKLALSGSGSIGSSASINIASGATLDVFARTDQTFMLNSGQTLTGGGMVTGQLSAAAGSIISPGSSIGTLTVQGNGLMNGLVLLQLNRTNAQTCDQLNCNGSLSAGGTLTVTNIGPSLQPGDNFQLFNQPVSGFSTVNLPSPGAGNGWANRLGFDGSLQVVSGAAVSPTSLTVQASGANLVLAWPQDHLGCRLQVQTNAPGAGLGTNWSVVTTSKFTNQLAIPLDPASGSAFFRLTFP